MKNIWILSVLWCIIMTGCYKEDTLSPSPEPEDVYGLHTLPQGNHDYDARILDLYGRYGRLILYKFEGRDFFWSMGADIRWKYNGIMTTTGLDAIPADDRYVGRQLDILEKCFLNYFPDTLLSRILPFKILLTDRILRMPLLYGPPDSARLEYPDASEAADYIAIARGNETNQTMTATEINAFKVAVCNLFMKRCVALNKILRSTEFANATAYSTLITPANMYSYGIFKAGVRILDADWEAYVEKIISTPLAAMEATGGILHPGMDTAGKVRKKYNIITAYFKDKYHIDLQAIGNDTPVL